ncbi:hypothetical protein [Pedobacter antarcticus]|nr:hypothetical protein [Pedobacter antarcticus]SDM48773.1 hypothetical protein SAMN04488084_107110 [Pedobacter antarcticus]SFE69373.1 hypothetical protein SAMN03003324_01118 [Pedobacter antarcticus]
MNNDNKNNFDWVYYVLGLFFGILTAAIISGSFGWSILGGIIGFILSAIFLNTLVKDRKY